MATSLFMAWSTGIYDMESLIPGKYTSDGAISRQCCNAGFGSGLSRHSNMSMTLHYMPPVHSDIGKGASPLRCVVCVDTDEFPRSVCVGGILCIGLCPGFLSPPIREPGSPLDYGVMKSLTTGHSVEPRQRICVICYRGRVSKPTRRPLSRK